MAVAPERGLSPQERARLTPAGLASLTVPDWTLMPITNLINNTFMKVAIASLRPQDRSLDQWRRVVLAVPPRAGKALEVETPIPTPTGWARMGDLEAGDWVFGGDGLPCRVVATTPIWRDRPLYAVNEARTGSTIFADAEHDWTGRWNRAQPVLRTGTSEELWRKAQTWQRPALWVPRHGGLDTPPLPLPVDPYLLGYWLGDGTSAHAALTVGLEDVDWVLTELDRLQVSWSWLGDGGRTGSRVIGLRGGIQAWLRHLGVLNAKYIPALYLRAGLEQRRSLLQGLVDSDGSVAEDGAISVDLANQRLAEDLQELLASLGVSAGLHHGYSQSQDRWGFHRWRTTFTAPDAARMPRKLARCRPSQTHRARYIVAQPSGRGDTKCIQVDSLDHLFLAGRAMLPTHNSEICSVNGPAWYLGHNPNKMLAVVSYEATFAEGFGALARNALQTYGPHFGTVTDPSSEAKDWWGTFDYRTGRPARGGMRAMGWQGPMIGKGFNLMVIDDPTKNAADALSPTLREAQKNWWQSTAKTRLEPGGAVLVVQQRWTEDDLPGYLMREEGLFSQVGPGGWTPVIVPLRAEPITAQHAPGLVGELADPLGRKPGEILITRFREEEMEERERTSDPFWWSAQFQQRPTARAGTLFLRDSFRYFEELPNHYRLLKQGVNWLVDKQECMRFATVDLAASMRDKADFFVAGLWAVTRNRDLILLDLIRGHFEGPEQDAILEGLWKLQHPAFIAIDANSYQLTMIQRMKRKGMAVRPIPADRDKYSRATLAATRFNSEGVFLPVANRSWKEPLISELLNFPYGTYDDQVDVVGYACTAIDPRNSGAINLRVVG